jgi:hypothetical protein
LRVPRIHPRSNASPQKLEFCKYGAYRVNRLKHGIETLRQITLFRNLDEAVTDLRRTARPAMGDRG